MAPDNAQAEAEGTLVLVAEDHATNRSLIMRQVNLLGYAVESVENGQEALEQWATGRFGIIITDCNMPVMNGYELTRSIREQESATGCGHIPILACTANALRGDGETCISTGMNDYLAKPVELRDLARKLDQWLPIPTTAAPLDPSVLAAITGGDPGQDLAVLVQFQQVNNEDAAMLDLARETGDISKVITASHRIKGASRAIGAIPLATVCEHLERASRAGDWNEIDVNMWTFHVELGRLNAYIEECQAKSLG